VCHHDAVDWDGLRRYFAGEAHLSVLTGQFSTPAAQASPGIRVPPRQ
jgi:hypothetical protein